MYRRILLGSPTACILFFHLFLLIESLYLFLFCNSAQRLRLWRRPSFVASGEVSGRRKGSRPPETQLAMNVCSRNFPPRFHANRLFGGIAQKVLYKNEIIVKRLLFCCMNGCNQSFIQSCNHATSHSCNHTTTQLWNNDLISTSRLWINNHYWLLWATKKAESANRLLPFCWISIKRGCGNKAIFSLNRRSSCLLR